MALRSRGEKLTPEQKAAEAQEKARQSEAEAQRRAEEKARKAFVDSPRGQARTAKLSGDRFFQTTINLEENERVWGLAGNIGTTKTITTGHGAVLTEIEAEGWELIEAGWLFRRPAQISPTSFCRADRRVRSKAGPSASTSSVSRMLRRWTTNHGIPVPPLASKLP